ncbi:MAG TPA: class I SAM-dependent methyltransferase [Acidimicrobiales bacterium]|nr:class I SAM-dependent methyltransferase [Acidimicrobiales bacterium]
MREFDPSAYGEGIADVYDEWYADLEVDEPVEALAALAGGGPVLELGVGTGRLALPLAARRLAVSGVDASTAMVARLKAKHGGDGIAVTVGDMAGPEPPGPFSLVFAAVNTFFGAFHRAEDQQACMTSVARRLQPGGRFVIEAFVPEPAESGDSVRVRQLSADRVVLTVTVTDIAAQTAHGQFVELVDGERVRLRPWSIRWCRPDELDAMATAAGLELEHRWGGWQGEPFTPDSSRHVSVWRQNADLGWSER